MTHPAEDDAQSRPPSMSEQHARDLLNGPRPPVFVRPDGVEPIPWDSVIPPEVDQSNLDTQQSEGEGEGS